MSIYGQRVDTSVANARTNNTPDTLIFGNFPFREAKLLYRVIVTTAGISETTDYRTAQYAGSTFTPTSHGSLTGLTSDDHPQYLLLAGRSGQTITDQVTITGVTSSLYGTASWATNALTASYVSSSNIIGNITSLSASWASASISSSYTLTASFASTPWMSAGGNIYYLSGNVGIGIISPINKLDVVGNISCSVITASLFYGTASYISFAPFATSASWASSSINAITSITATQSLYSTQSLYATSASWVSASAFITLSQTASYISSSAIFDKTTYNHTASWAIIAVTSLTSTQSLYATSSIYAISASWVSASVFITTAQTASYITSSNIVGYVTALSSSWASASLSSSWLSVLSVSDNNPYNIILSSGTSTQHAIAGGTTSQISFNPGTSVFNVGTSITSTSITSSLCGTASWAQSASYAITASYVSSSNIIGYITAYSSSWASASISASYALTSSVSVSSSIANTASYVQGGNVMGTVVSASYAKNAQLIIDMDWHLMRNSNTSLQTTHNFVPGTILLARNGILCTSDYITTEYDYFESGSNYIQLHFSMSGDTKMMVVYVLSP